ncbi:MAG TPA: hypothetical protein VNS32_14310 [Flavisolibacter sp.]|nr:hypothetical protein [Flavisolibacter sp.]
MTNEEKNTAERDIIFNEMLHDVEALKQEAQVQEEQLSRIRDSFKEIVNRIGQQTELISQIKELLKPQNQDHSSLETLITQKVEEVKAEVNNQHKVVMETKRYSIFGDRFGGELFTAVLNASMKWLLALIGLHQLISIVKFLIHYHN